MNQIKSGIALSYLSLAIINVVGILFTPYLINILGNHEYGVFSIVGGLMGMLSLINFGLGGTLVRFIAKYRGENDTKGIENLLALSLLLFTALGVIMIITGLTVAYNLALLFPNLATEDIEQVKVMFIILAVSTAVSLPGIVFHCIQVAYERFIFSKVLEIIKTLVRVIAIVALLEQGHNAIAVIAVDAVVLLITFLLNAQYVYKRVNVNIKLHNIDAPLLMTVFRYSFWFAVGMLVSQLTWNSGQLILARTGTTSDVAIFSVAVALSGYFISIAMAISNIYSPRASFMEGAGAKDEDFSHMLINIGRSQLLIVGLFLVGFIAIGKSFIYLWLGNDYISSFYVTCLLILPVILSISQGFANSVVQAKNLVAMSTIIKLIFACISVIAAYFLSLHYGLFGVAVSLSICWLVNLVFLNFFYHFYVKLDIITFIYKCWLPFLPLFILTVGVGLYINDIFVVTNWLDLFINSALVTVIYLVAAVVLFLNTAERLQVYNFMRINNLLRSNHM
jgi:O-antigen/teichoic acid export membrane protein